MIKKLFTILLFVSIYHRLLLGEAVDPSIKQFEHEILAVRPLPLQDVRLTGGPLKNAQDIDVKTLLGLDPDRMMAGYRFRAGLKMKAKGYGGWDSIEGKQLTGHIAGHYLSAVSIMYAATGNEEFKKRADYIVQQMKEVQDKRGNGYLGALANKDGVDGAEIFEKQVARGDIRSAGFDLNGMWSPWYTLHKTYAGLRDAYRYTGNNTALALEIKFASWGQKILSNLTDAQIQKMLNTEFGGMNEIFIDLYADTGDRQWLEMSYKFEHKSFTDPLKRHVDNLPGKHGNTQVPKLIGSADRFAYTGTGDDIMAAGFFWDRVVHHHSFATGGHGKDEYFWLADKLNDYVDGRTCETCNVYNMLKLTRRLFAIYPDPQYADFYEQALFNHILASLDPTDGWACYMVPVGRGVRHEYERNMLDGGFTCCTGTSLESHGLHGDGIYYESGDKLYVNIYTPSRAGWKSADVNIEVETDFPEGQSAKLKISTKREKQFCLALRRPYWADGFEVRINGKKVSDDILAETYVPGVGRNLTNRKEQRPSWYVNLDRKWSDGDTVEVVMPKSLRLVPVPDDANRVAIAWGPVVLAGDLGAEFGPKPKRIPIFVAADKPVESWLKPVEGKPGHFKTAGVGRPEDVEFVPFYRLHRRLYGIYWDLFTADQWQAKEAEYAAEENRRRLLAQATVGFAQPGQMQPERDYNFQSSDDSDPIRIEGRPGRQGYSWFSFDMPVDDAHPMTLVVTYYSDEHFRRPAKFDILLDGDKVTDQEIRRSSPERFYDIQYPIDAKLVKGKKKVTVKFEAHTGCRLASVFGIRTVRADAIK